MKRAIYNGVVDRTGAYEKALEIGTRSAACMYPVNTVWFEVLRRQLVLMKFSGTVDISI